MNVLWLYNYILFIYIIIFASYIIILLSVGAEFVSAAVENGGITLKNSYRRPRSYLRQFNTLANISVPETPSENAYRRILFLCE